MAPPWPSSSARRHFGALAPSPWTPLLLLFAAAAGDVLGAPSHSSGDVGGSPVEVESRNGTKAEGGLATGSTALGVLSRAGGGILDFGGISHLAVVRLKHDFRAFDWFQPYNQGAEQSVQFTGFAVYLEDEDGKVWPSREEFDKDPLFVTTCSLGVEGRITLTYPDISPEPFEAYVAATFQSFELALLKLREPAKLLKAFEDVCKLHLHSLEHSDHGGTSGSGGGIGARGRCSLFDRALAVRRLERRPTMQMMKVGALGFPMMQNSGVKFTTGTFSGVQTVASSGNQMVLYQHSAPIQTAGLGGPLIEHSDSVRAAIAADKKDRSEAEAKNERKPQLFGVNIGFSPQPGAQNVDYVVPSIHIRQMLRFFQSRERECSLDPGAVERGIDLSQTPMAKADCKLMVAPVSSIVTTEPSDIMYEISGCSSGVHIDKIPPHSGLAGIVEPGQYITKVDGRHIDKMGNTAYEDIFSDETNIRFDVVMKLIDSIDEHASVELTVCLPNTGGREVVKRVPMRWDDARHGFPIDTVHAPSTEYRDLRQHFELFAGLTFMRLTLNHVTALAPALPEALMLMEQDDPRAQAILSLLTYSLPEKRTEERLLVTSVDPASFGAKFMVKGMVVESVNGHTVHSLDDFREHFVPKAGDATWVLRTETGEVLMTDFEAALNKQVVELAEQRGPNSVEDDILLSDAVKRACEAHRRCKALLEASTSSGRRTSSKGSREAMEVEGMQKVAKASWRMSQPALSWGAAALGCASLGVCLGWIYH